MMQVGPVEHCAKSHNTDSDLGNFAYCQPLP
jgi:hypothetical protein